MSEQFRILLTKEISEAALETLERVGEVRLASDMSEEVLIEESKDVDAIVVGALGAETATVGRAEKSPSALITANIIVGASRLKVIGHAARPMPRGEVENVAIRAATRRGVIIVFVPQAYGYSIADHAIGLLLAAAKRIPQTHCALKLEGKWDLADEYIGTDVSFKTLGILGFGRIGQLVAQRARAFEMPILVFDPYVPQARVDEMGAELVDLEVLLERSDFVSNHLPRVPSTYHMIGEREFDLMKPEAFLICTVGGGVVDDEALIAALSTGRIAGAALDRFENEPLEPSSPLLKMENVIVTPKWAYRVKSLNPDRCVAEDIVRVLTGQRPIHIANPDVLEVLSGQCRT